MAVGAQAAELAEPERVVVPSMRRVVVSDGRWSDDAAFQAERDRKLMRSAPLPACGAIPAVNIERCGIEGKVFSVWPDKTARAQRAETKRAFVRDASRNFLGLG